jgi:uncharacterized glyoxalase superfamily protein PhnB
MTIAASHTPLGPSDKPACGCCGRDLAGAQLTELGATPGVFICGNCAWWATRRLHTWARIRLPRFRSARLRAARLSRRARTPTSAAHPILQVRDLHRSEVFYCRLGLGATFHHPDYLIMTVGPVELQFAREPEPCPASGYVDAEDAGRLWEQFGSRGIEGLGPVEDFDYGMREFVLTDRDGNRLRVGSSIPGR